MECGISITAIRHLVTNVKDFEAIKRAINTPSDPWCHVHFAHLLERSRVDGLLLVKLLSLDLPHVFRFSDVLGVSAKQIDVGQEVSLTMRPQFS